MKKHFLFTLFLVGLGLSNVANESFDSFETNPKRVLWIGNSYTYVNDLPQMTVKAAQSAGDDFTYESNTPGGYSFQGHCQNHSITLIQQGGWDIVILQGQSEEPSFPPFQVEAETFPYAQQLVESIYHYNDSTVEPMFYMTWGHKNGDPRNASNYPPLATYEGMDSLLFDRYMYMGHTFNASVCPVGRVWHYLRDNHPEIELYQSDDSHPSVAGSYVSACAFYTMIFEKDPTRISFCSTLDTATASIIRSTVKTIVFDNLSQWKRESWSPSVGIESLTTSSNKPNGAYRLYDVTGRLLIEGENAETFSMWRSSLPKGVYILRSTKGDWCRKVVKQR